MKRSTIPLPLLLIALLTGPVSARIGETPAQCAKRYGTPLQTSSAATADHGLESSTHRKAGFLISIIYHGGKCTTLIIEPESARPVDRHPIPDVQIQKILDSNLPSAASGPWKENPAETHPTRTDFDGDPVVRRSWKTSDGTLLASYDTGTHLLILVSAAQKKANIAAREAAQKAAVEDF